MWVTGGTRHGFHRLVLLVGGWGETLGGKERERGNFRKSCKKFREVNLTVEPQEITGRVQQLSIRPDACKWLRGSVCANVRVCMHARTR